MSGILTALASLCAVIGLIVLLQHLARRKLRMGQGRLALAETIALDARRRLHLVRCGGRYLLLETGGAQDLFVGWLAEEP